MRDQVLASGLLLRPFVASDAASLLATVDGSRLRLARWMPWVPYSTTVSDFAAFIDGAGRSEADGGAFHRGLFSDGVPVGAVGASLDLVNHCAEVGYWLVPEWEGRGVVTEAVGLMLDFLFEEMAVHRVALRAATQNRRSRAVAERLGFEFEGVLREALWLEDRPTDTALYSLLEPEWRGRREGQ
ncbi:MAG: GNAT family protein [Acidimicrobiia bacterium]|nr:MAG: GNAT family protein [Acidimicrobiia bacterium]